jgi:ComF family protein
MALQALIHAIYPPQCITCKALVATDFGLCGDCWRDTPFITGLVCCKCGSPLPGDVEDENALCDDCLQHPRPWVAGRSVMMYRDNARRIVLALKHGDQMDLARPAGDWLARAARPMLRPGMVAVPVPLHWRRMLMRKYNQAVLLSAALARSAGLEHCPDALVRARHTGSQEGRTRDERMAGVQGAFAVNPRRLDRVKERHILLVDDVMTSGATFTAATEALLAADVASVSVLSLARVAKAD